MAFDTAIILAGGMGERLRPVTNHLPKALVPVDGIPMIEKQLTLLYQLGIRRVYILTGYLSAMIAEYIEKNIDLFEFEVHVIQTPEEYSSRDRILFSSAEIGNNFLLLYCDNYVFDIEKLSCLLNSKAPITFFVEKRSPGNIFAGENFTAHYTSKRSESNSFVELGFIKISYEDFFVQLANSDSLQECLQNISIIERCMYIETDQILISLSNFDRYLKLRRNRRTLLIDRDGVINVKMPHRKYLARFEDFKLIESNINALSELAKNDFDFILITNQPGIATGDVQSGFLKDLHLRLTLQLLVRGVPLIAIYVCIHHWDDECDCRKPKPGMLNSAINDFELNPQVTYYVGDETKDIQAAIGAKISGIRIGDSNDPERLEFLNLYDAIPIILSKS